MANKMLSLFLPHFFTQLETETVSPIPEPRLPPSEATMQTYERAANALADQLDRVENEIKRLETLKHELSISYDSILVATKALTVAKHGAPEAAETWADLEKIIADGVPSVGHG